MQIPDFWNECEQDGTLDKLKSCSSHQDKLMIGFADGTSFTGQSYTYYIGTPYDGDALPDGYTTASLPERTWAVFRCVNLSDQATNEVAFKKIFSEFFPTSEYEPTQEYQLEVWPDDGHRHPDEIAEVWISVRKR